MTDSKDGGEPTLSLQRSEPLTLPVIALRDHVLFPGVSLPIAAGRAETLRAIEAALRQSDKRVFAVLQREDEDHPSPEDLYTIGTIARIEQIQRSLAGVQVLLHGERRGIAVRVSSEDGYLHGVVREAEQMAPLRPEDPGYEALYKEVHERAAELGQKAGLPSEIVEQVLGSVEDPGVFADLVAAYMEAQPEDRQELLETLSVEERLRRVLVLVQRQIGVLDAQEDIKSKVQEELGDRQREIILREQLKAIQEELGEYGEGEDLSELRTRLDALELNPDARKEIEREFNRLARSGRESMESQVIRTYLETVAELPWNERDEEQLDLGRASGILDQDHYGLEEVKDRVLEFLAVRQLAAEESAAAEADESEQELGSADLGTAEAPSVEADGNEGSAVEDGDAPLPGNDDDQTRGPILLFTGPPGVGKTSIAKSIARSMGRKYVRISLGGARDEADIRGHRRTYVGAMPGRIINGMKQAGSKNPVFLLDEIDKLGVSFQGDPASALLEVLDPAQNDSFTDHYLGIPFDLSEVLFICTANYPQNIPGPLLDRMEVVNFAGYTEREKLEIAKRYLVPRQLRSNSVSEDRLTITDEAVAEVITGYTREAGVRQLERELGRLARKVARTIASGEARTATLAPADVRELLGRPKVHPEKAAAQDQVGVATGMSYTPVGGDIIFVEASKMPGKGRLVLTGQLGDVMKESAQAAWTYAKATPAPSRSTRASSSTISTSTSRPAPSPRTVLRRASRWPPPWSPPSPTVRSGTTSP